MKNGKLVIGIISIVLFVLVGMQSCAAGLSNALSSNGGSQWNSRTFTGRQPVDCRHRSNLHPAQAVKAVISALVFT